MKWFTSSEIFDGFRIYFYPTHFPTLKFGVGLGSGLPAHVIPSTAWAPVRDLPMASSTSNRSEDKELSSITQGKTHYLRTVILSLLLYRSKK